MTKRDDESSHSAHVSAAPLAAAIAAQRSANGDKIANSRHQKGAHPQAAQKAEDRHLSGDNDNY